MKNEKEVREKKGHDLLSILSVRLKSWHLKFLSYSLNPTLSRLLKIQRVFFTLSPLFFLVRLSRVALQRILIPLPSTRSFLPSPFFTHLAFFPLCSYRFIAFCRLKKNKKKISSVLQGFHLRKS